VADYEVTCVSLDPVRPGHYGVITLSGFLDGSAPWTLTCEDVAMLIDEGHTFSLTTDFGRAYLATFGESYVQAYVGGRWTDDLLHLPACTA
jgi:hypothetical protein